MNPEGIFERNQTGQNRGFPYSRTVILLKRNLIGSISDCHDVVLHVILRPAPSGHICFCFRFRGAGQDCFHVRFCFRHLSPV